MIKRTGSGSLVEIFKKQGGTTELPENSPFKHKKIDESPRPHDPHEAFRQTIEAERKAREDAVAKRYENRKRKLEDGKNGFLQVAKREKEDKANKKTGLAIGLKTNRRELGGPVLRRDPTAHAKLHVIQWMKNELQRQGLPRDSLVGVPGWLKRKFEV